MRHSCFVLESFIVLIYLIKFGELCHSTFMPYFDPVSEPQIPSVRLSLLEVTYHLDKIYHHNLKNVL